MTLLADKTDIMPDLGIEAALDTLLKHRFCIVQDDDANYYVIPVHFMDEWYERTFAFDESLTDEYWVDRVGGAPSNVTFSTYDILR